MVQAAQHQHAHGPRPLVRWCWVRVAPIKLIKHKFEVNNPLLVFNEHGPHEASAMIEVKTQHIPDPVRATDGWWRVELVIDGQVFSSPTCWFNKQAAHAAAERFRAVLREPLQQALTLVERYMGQHGGSRGQWVRLAEDLVVQGSPSRYKLVVPQGTIGRLDGHTVEFPVNGELVRFNGVDDGIIEEWSPEQRQSGWSGTVVP